MLKAKVLNAGSIELISFMGSEQSIVDAARVSIAGENVKPTSTNIALLRYLLRNKHTSPFEMVEVKFRVKCPIFIARQWMRHRTWSFNEVSARYSELPAEMWEPLEIETECQWRRQSSSNKQCSEGVLTSFDHDIQYIDSIEDAANAYYSLLEVGIAREQARAVLPVATYTTFIAKVDLHNLLHFIKLRNHPHAQKEIRDYAQVISDWVKQLWPNVWQAFMDYEVNSVTLTACDIEKLTNPDYKFPTKREENEYREKMSRLRLPNEGA